MALINGFAVKANGAGCETSIKVVAVHPVVSSVTMIVCVLAALNPDTVIVGFVCPVITVVPPSNE